MITTLNKIRAHRPCYEGWAKLLRYLGKTQADDEPLNIATVIDSNGVDDALWCLCAVDDCDREIRLFAVWCARQAARAAARDASRDLAQVTWDAALTAQAARVAAREAARPAARDAAWVAAVHAQAAELRRICSNFPIATNPIQPCANG